MSLGLLAILFAVALLLQLAIAAPLLWAGACLQRRPQKALSVVGSGLLLAGRSLLRSSLVAPEDEAVDLPVQSAGAADLGAPRIGRRAHRHPRPLSGPAHRTRLSRP